MAKDPAVLFYTSDFLTGTLLMTNEQKGKYITLLCLQHQKGVLSEKDMLNICTSYDKDVFDKFIKTEDGYYNERMRFEHEKRSNFSKSRSENRLKGIANKGNKKNKKKSSSYDYHMENENDNISIVIDYLNSICNKNYKKSSDKTKSVISARLKEGFTIEDFKKVVDYKFKQWSIDPQMKDYLRPETLFGTKFESYLQSTKITLADQKKSEAPDYAKFLHGE